MAFRMVDGIYGTFLKEHAWSLAYLAQFSSPTHLLLLLPLLTLAKLLCKHPWAYRLVEQQISAFRYTLHDGVLGMCHRP